MRFLLHRAKTDAKRPGPAIGVLDRSECDSTGDALTFYCSGVRETFERASSSCLAYSTVNAGIDHVQQENFVEGLSQRQTQRQARQLVRLFGDAFPARCPPNDKSRSAARKTSGAVRRGYPLGRQSSGSFLGDRWLALQGLIYHAGNHCCRDVLRIPCSRPGRQAHSA